MSPGSGEEVTEGTRRPRAVWGRQGVAPGFSCGVRTSLREEGSHFFSAQLDTVWRALDAQYKGGENIPTAPLGYSKAQNTALMNHVESLVNHSWWAFKPRPGVKAASRSALRRWSLKQFTFLSLAPRHGGISHHSSQQRPDPK